MPALVTEQMRWKAATTEQTTLANFRSVARRSSTSEHLIKPL